MTKPTFLIIGAMKAGTTTLYNLLAQHPQIYMSPVKEPNFYAYVGGRPKRSHPPGLPYPEWIIDTPDSATLAMERQVDAATFTTETAYRRLWIAATEPEKGEASVLYLYLPHVAETIASMNPATKLVVILRNPVDRAYSHFLMARRMGREPIASFADAVRAEASRLTQNYDPFWHYGSLGYYSEQLQRYLNAFPPTQIFIMLTDDLKEDLQPEYTRLLQFLGVDISFAAGPYKEHNLGGIPRYKWLYDLVTRESPVKDWLKRVIPPDYQLRVLKQVVLSKPRLDAELRQQLVHCYLNDISHLEDLIGRDLSQWKQ